MALAKRWVEEQTRDTISTLQCAEQHNAGRGFALVRFVTDSRRQVWLKAVGPSNLRELSVTRLLAVSSPAQLPAIIGERPEWNGWLMDDAGKTMRECNEPTALAAATSCLAAIQLATRTLVERLIDAGATDYRCNRLLPAIAPVTAFLIDAMRRQVSTRSQPLSETEVMEIGIGVRRACEEVEELQIPDTLLNNDLNSGNLLVTDDRCVITDWCEAGVGMPFVSFHDLCRMNSECSLEMREIYSRLWQDYLSSKQTKRALALAPLLSIFCKLHGRGDWLGTDTEMKPWFQSYARTLAREMHRSVREAFAPGAIQC
ncbi:MAG: hypothetical protein PW792_04565 [Acidobacteriaceae bacterium]|nr:hypothetical protein [Acidobacteriaceae bacterium]